MPRHEELKVLKALLSHIGQHSQMLAKKKLTGFLPMVGDRFTKCSSLMVVGRAVNGWEPYFFADELRFPARVDEVAQAILTRAEQPPRMGWVADAWQNANDYNTARSAFWRVIKRVVHELGLADVNDPQWPSCLLWSNLYKIAPGVKGNPAGGLRNLQQQHCQQLLELEVRRFKPAKMLFLTEEPNDDWAVPFLRGWTRNLQRRQQTFVKAVACADLGCKQPTKVVVAVHPQGKNETNWVNQVVAAFNGLNCNNP